MKMKSPNNLLESLPFLNSMNIAAKVWLGVSFLVAGYSLSTILGYTQSGDQHAKIGYISEEAFPATQLCQEALAEFDLQTKFYNDAVVMGETELLEQANEQADAVRQALEKITENAPMDSDRAQVVRNLVSDMAAFADSAFEVYTALSGFDIDPKTQKRAAVLAGTQKELSGRLEELLESYSNSFLHELDTMKADSRRQLNLTLAVFLTMLLTAAAAIAFIVTNGISKPLKHAVELANAVHDGDLSKRLNLTTNDEIGSLAKSLDAMADGLKRKADLAESIANGNLSAEAEISSDRDRFGKSLAHMVDNLNTMMTEVLVASSRVNDGSILISNSSHNLSNGASSQAASLEEITASVTELSDGTQSNAENAAHAEKLARKTEHSASEGVEKIEVLTEAMEGLTVASQEIAKIIKVIDDIAFQTNLLALNAAVEAARAGKHGKGFAVVAEEVRNLAGRSAKAASETATLIETAIKKVENGSALTADTSRAFTQIRDGVLESSELMGKVATASNHQASGISEISEGMKQIDAITQNNAAGSEEMASAAQDLSMQAQGLQEILGRFTLKDSGDIEADHFTAPAQPSAEKQHREEPLNLTESVGAGW